MYTYLVTCADRADNPDFIADFTLFITWSEVKVNVAILTCCMPTLSPVVGKFYSGLTGSLRSILPGTWSFLSHERDGSKEASAGNNRPAVGTLIPLDDRPWLRGIGTVTSAGYTDLEGQPYYEGGILARTEIQRSSEPKYS